MSTNPLTFLTNRLSRLISLPTSTIFVYGTSGMTAILWILECKSYMTFQSMMTDNQSSRTAINLKEQHVDVGDLKKKHDNLFTIVDIPGILIFLFLFESNILLNDEYIINLF